MHRTRTPGTLPGVHPFPPEETPMPAYQIRASLAVTRAIATAAALWIIAHECGGSLRTRLLFAAVGFIAGLTMALWSTRAPE